MDNVKLEDVMDAILGLKSATEAGFVRVDARLDRIDGRLDRVEIRLDRVEIRLDRLTARVERVETKIDALTFDMAEVKNRLTVVESRV